MKMSRKVAIAKRSKEKRASAKQEYTYYWLSKVDEAFSTGEKTCTIKFFPKNLVDEVKRNYPDSIVTYQAEYTEISF